MNKLDKAQLRRRLLQKRQSLPQADWKEKSDRLCGVLQSLSIFQEAQTILAYWSFRQEPDLSPLWTTRRWGLPRCVGQSLQWHQWSTQAPLQTGRYGIREPHPDSPTVSPTEVDLILVPAIACDYGGYRLGYGGGFYDRMLSSPEWLSIKTIGIVFDFAYLAELPLDPWDRKLHGVCTDTGYQD